MTLMQRQDALTRKTTTVSATLLIETETSRTLRRTRLSLEQVLSLYSAFHKK